MTEFGVLEPSLEATERKLDPLVLLRVSSMEGDGKLIKSTLPPFVLEGFSMIAGGNGIMGSYGIHSESPLGFHASFRPS